MRYWKRAFVGFYLNGLLGTGKCKHVTIPAVKSMIEEGSILEYLKTEFKDDIDLSVLTPLDRLELIGEWMDMLDVSESRKYCVDENGICLLVAYLLEGLQTDMGKLQRGEVIEDLEEG